MATIYQRGPNPIWFMANHTGVPLDDTYWAFFLTNDLPYVPQTVYQDPNGIAVWSNPLEFQPSSGLPNNLYFDPNLVYRIEIRQGNSQSDPLIWLIENYIPGDNQGSGSDTDSLLTNENMITNPQFADILFESPLSITSAGTYDIAPGWQLVLTGTGTTTITQVLTAGIDNAVGNPAYALRFNNSGWTTAILRQRLSNNGALFDGGAVGATLTAYATGSSETVTVSYVPSTGTGTTIFSAVVLTGTFQTFQGVQDIANSTNTDTGEDAYVDFRVTLPATGDVTISNLQFTGQENPLVDSDIMPVYQEISYERMVDQTFHYYKDQLIEKPIPSYLVGWDFPLNPAQFLGTSVSAQAVGANKSYYAWDQTIAFQSADSGITITRSSDGSLNLAPAATTQMAVIQYLDATQAKKILQHPIAVNLSAYCDIGFTLKVTISLWWTTDASLPDINAGTNNSLVATLDADGKPATFNGNWTEVARTTGISPVTTLSPQVSPQPGVNFNGWDLADNALADTATFFAIVIGTESMPVGDSSLYIRSVSLSSGDIATLPAPQTQDQVLRECQFYYEKSYSTAVAPGTVSALDQVFSAQLPNAVSGAPDTVRLKSRTYMISYNTAKRTDTPTITFYSPVTGTADRVRGYTKNAGAALADADITQSTNWTSVYDGQKFHAFTPSNVSDLIGPTATVGNSFAEAYILFHYTIDCRLGIN